MNDIQKTVLTFLGFLFVELLSVPFGKHAMTEIAQAYRKGTNYSKFVERTVEKR